MDVIGTDLNKKRPYGIYLDVGSPISMHRSGLRVISNLMKIPSRLVRTYRVTVTTAIRTDSE